MAVRKGIQDNRFSQDTKILSVSFGKDCRYVGRNAFLECTSLSKINDGNNIDTIGAYAFASTKLSSATFNGLISLYDGAFESCSELYHISMPECISIPSSAFKNCISLKDIEIKKTISIKDYAFNGCRELSSISASSCAEIGNHAFDGCTSLYYVNVLRCGEIGEYAFNNCSSLKEINMPNVSVINNHAFDGCDALSSISILKCNIIGSYAFSNCVNLISASVNNVSIYGSAFYNCQNLSNINLYNCSKIGPYAFGNCTKLSEINLGNCEIINDYAFLSCTSLTQVSIYTCSVIGSNAFKDCKLEKFYVNNTRDNFCELKNANAFGGSMNSLITLYFRADTISSYKTAKNWSVFSTHMEMLAMPNHIVYRTSNKSKHTIPESISGIISHTYNTTTNYGLIEFENDIKSLNQQIFKNSNTLTYIDLPYGCESIGNNEFEGCLQLTNIKIPDTLTEIGKYAFKNCTSLETFKIPYHIEILGEGAFVGCKNIKTFESKNTAYDGSAVIHNNTLICVSPSPNDDNTEGRFYDMDGDDTNSITRLGELCFSGCVNTRRIDISKNVTSIGDRAFEGCRNLCEIHFKNDLTPPTIGNNIFKDIHNDFKIFVPQERLEEFKNAWTQYAEHIYPRAGKNEIIFYGDLDDKTGAFYQGSGQYNIIKNVQNSTLPTSYFKEQAGLLKVILGDGITKIEKEAFCGCNNLEYVYLSDNVQNLSNNCFYNCTNLKRIHIPINAYDHSSFSDNVSVFEGCKNLKEFGTYRKGYVSNDNRCVIKNKELIFFASGDISEYTIPNNITKIHRSVFRCTDLERITLTESITTIEQSVFENCTNLEYISNWNNVVSIPERAFSGCKNLGEITLPANLKSIGNHAFSGCEKMYINTNIPTSVETIGEYAFSECTNFKCVINGDVQILNIGDISYIDKNTFEKCTSLTKVSIGSNIEAIGECAFSECTNLNEVIFPIDSCIKSIEDLAFYKCENLTDLNLSNDLTYIGTSAFEKCKKYKGNSLIAADGRKSYILTIPENLSNMGVSCFQESGVEFLNIPGDRVLPGISHKAFYGCEELTTITMSTAQNLQYISAEAFKGCSNLRGDTNKQLDLPESIKFIDDMAFQGCNSISRVYLQKGISSLGNFCFETGRSTDFFLAHNTVLDTPPRFTIGLLPSEDNSYPFGKVSDSSTTEPKIYVYNDVLESFKTNEYWSKYADYIFVMP